MKRILFCVLSLLTVCLGCQSRSGEESQNLVINGSGATFPAPVYANWTYNYTQTTGGRVQINYQGVGSGAGITQVCEGTVDFAGTDSPLSGEDLEKQNLSQFPMLAGGVVLIYNLPGLQQDLTLSPSALADIFLGRITRWNDPKIQADNDGITLPATAISVVHRSDSSGTTFIFTNYLSKVSPTWKSEAGEGKTVAWPCGIGGQKNPGVCNNVAKIEGGIGYTEYTYALESKLPCARLINAAGKTVSASPAGFSAALESADWDSQPGFGLVLTNAPGDDSYPIAAVTYIVYKNSLEENRKKELCNYINWCFDSGKTQAAKLNYVPMPGKLVNGQWER